MVREPRGIYLPAMRTRTPSAPPPRGRPRPHRWLVPVLAALALAGGGDRVAAQQPDAARVGISVGGISTVGLVVEYVSGRSSWEINVGTWSFRDLSVSLVRRWYLGVEEARPTVGVGVWGVLALPPDGRPSVALVARAPVGVEWRFASRHAAVLDLNVNQGLFIRRSDPDDDTPMNRRLIPLPGLSTRWRSR